MQSSEITLDDWNAALDRCIQFVNENRCFEEAFDRLPCSETYVLESLIKEFQNGNRSRKLYDQMLKYTARKED